MLKEVVEQVELMETLGRAKKANLLRDMLSTLEERVVKLEEFIGDMMEMLELVKRLTGEFDSRREQLRDFVLESLCSNMEKVQGVLNSTRNKLIERNDAFEAMVIALKEETMATMMALSTIIEELKEELALC
ncbi:hypothetical protein PVK06_048316 [Gossypium arboreum]|uniref:Uncharacterized protein n=1 Tax=Gossypium arboreum TaxID=29729 RepID=A0ABR0MHM2_GOSAR|nr:hypothetical protein PVK06_048316 [Gossypium arboreum]